MEKIQFDTGVQSYRINGDGILRFNPADPNLFARFMEAADQIQAMENRLANRSQEEKPTGEQTLKLLREADQEIKKLLGWVFGGDNDFEKLLGGVNLLARASNSQLVVTNLFAALQPVLLAGAESATREQTQAAVAKAKARRASV